MADLKHKTVAGMIWSAIQKFGVMGISFVSNMVLARLLSADEMGCIGLLAIFILLSNTFIDGGFGSALIQKKQPTQSDYSTIFWWNMGLSVVLYGVLFLAAPWVAAFYKMDILCDVLRVQGLVLIFNALCLIQNNQLRKKLKFKLLATTNIAAAVVSVVVAIVLAYMGWGVWSLVAQQLVLSIMGALLLWIVGRWRPSFVFSVSSFKELFHFGFFILLSNLINTFCNNIQGLLIGRIYNPATMGYYSQARKLEQVSSNSLSQIVDQVAYPVLAEAQNDKAYMQNILKKLITSLAFVVFPLMMVMALTARPLIVLIYSAKWLPAVPYFQILCIAGTASCLQGLNYYAVAAVGKSGSLFRWTLLKRLCGLVFVVGGLWLWGMTGLLSGMVMTSFFIYLVNAYLVEQFVGYGVLRQLKDLVPVTLLTLAAFAVGYLVQVPLSECGMFLRGGVAFVAFVIVYLGVAKVFRIEAMAEALMLLGQVKNKFTKNRK